MKIWAQFIITLDEIDRWDATRSGLTINVHEIQVNRRLSRAADGLWLVGPRRLLRGGLSVQAPEGMLAQASEIPEHLRLRFAVLRIL